MQDGRLQFEGDSDAVIVKGLIGLLIRVLSNQKPEDIAKANLYFIANIGMSNHLAQTRSNGLSFYGKANEALWNCLPGKTEVK
jgi:cysteine desulfuration protein SufE